MDRITPEQAAVEDLLFQHARSSVIVAWASLQSAVELETFATRLRRLSSACDTLEFQTRRLLRMIGLSQ